jgi:hypothetical protein
MSTINFVIKSVQPATASGTTYGTKITDIPAGSKADWSKIDLSAPDAGRVESGRMLKKRRGKVDRYDLEWRGLSAADASKVLKAFDFEYTMIEYYNPLEGTIVTKHFYVGDMAAAGWIPHQQKWERVTLPIIRATPDT